MFKPNICQNCGEVIEKPGHKCLYKSDTPKQAQTQRYKSLKEMCDDLDARKEPETKAEKIQQWYDIRLRE
jgi:hypothetical protein